MTDTRPILPLTFGIEGPRLTVQERMLLSEFRPFGVILFQRNCISPGQLRALIIDLKRCAGDVDLPILIDQEGGRVQRMKEPGWPALPAMAEFGAIAAHDGLEVASDALRRHMQTLNWPLGPAGISINCVPVLDLPQPGADPIISDRALSADPDTATALGRIVIEETLKAGGLPVMKHLPGHGRAEVDTHKALPRISTPLEELKSHDFKPFKALANLCPLAMTAHVVLDAIDPDTPATQSPRVIDEVIRGEIGFDGLLMTDDISMGALDGSLTSRAQKALDAGCDLILYCKGEMEEMRDLASSLPAMTQTSLDRWQKARRMGEPETA
ncbi:MAG: beta-N-acetylhexosaminidase [Alphaproteobacteria bacterium]